LLETIASQATIALENARLFDRMQTLAMTDTLTGIYNRRQFMSLGVQEFQRARRYNRNFSVIMIDIDHFKKVNDTYGHMVGDSVLQQVAVLIQRTLRSVDIPGRYGGEEFSIILPETGTEEAQRVAERLRSLLEEKVMLVVNHSIRITASFGVASYVRDDQSLETLLNQADRALYTAKQAGRNQVKIYSPAMDE